mgnify:CR=1 FL=1
MKFNELFDSAEVIGDDQIDGMNEIYYFGQSWFGDEQLEGFWWTCDDDQMVVGIGRFGNYNSPGTMGSYYRFHDASEYENACRFLESQPEYMDDSE